MPAFLQIRKRNRNEDTNISLKSLWKTSTGNETVRKKFVGIGQTQTCDERNVRGHKRCNHSEGVCLRTRKKLLRKSSCPEKLHTLYSERLKPPSVLHFASGDEGNLLKQRFFRKCGSQGYTGRKQETNIPAYPVSLTPPRKSVNCLGGISNTLNTDFFSGKLSPYVTLSPPENMKFLSPSHEETGAIKKAVRDESSMNLNLEFKLPFKEITSPVIENKHKFLEFFNRKASLNEFTDPLVHNAGNTVTNHLSQDIILNSTAYDSESDSFFDETTIVIRTPEQRAQYEEGDECRIDINADISPASSFVVINDVTSAADDNVTNRTDFD